MSNPAISIHQLSKFIQAKPIVLRMDLNIPKGSLFGLLGPNGAGKSTTLKLLTGQLRATSGSMDVLGYDPWKERVPLFRKIGYLPQNPSLHKDKSVLRFMTYMSRLKGFSGSQAIVEARSKIDQLGLSRFEQNTVGKLSGGETQRLGFANALIGDPELLILDEPTASLDPEGRIYVIKLISDLSKLREQTIIISSHILPEIQRMCKSVAIMSEGRVLISGNVRQLTKSITDDEYEIKTSHPEDLSQVLQNEGYNVTLDLDTLIVHANGKLKELWHDIPRISVEKGFTIMSFKPVRDPLESVFIKLISNEVVEQLKGENENE